MPVWEDWEDWEGCTLFSTVSHRYFPLSSITHRYPPFYGGHEKAGQETSHPASNFKNHALRNAAFTCG